jgi:2-hydroxychromene-2-carboxylate isomerase
VRIGLSTPVVIQMPGVASPWERDADIEDPASVARVADELGFDFLTCSVAAASAGHYCDQLAALDDLGREMQ